MKTKEELNVLKEEVETLNKKLAALSDEELKQISGGTIVICQRFVNSYYIPKPYIYPSDDGIHSER